MEWVPYLTVKLVDDFATHLKLFGLAIQHCEKLKEEGTVHFIAVAFLVIIG